MGTLNLAPLDEASLRALMEKSESDDLEFKAKILSNSEIADYVVGIGNAGGGFLIMGITDKQPRRISGLGALSVDAMQKIRRSVYDSTSVRVELEPVSTAEGVVLGVRIPPRPPGAVLHTREGGYLIRVGEDLMGLTAAQIQTMLSESGFSSNIVDELPISVRFTMLQHLQNYNVLVKNNSDAEDIDALSQIY
jgi:predicted HTH transcriptional regulator